MLDQEQLTTTVAAFEHWRTTRTSTGAKIPSNLRQLAVDLLPHYRISLVIRTLRISHSQLKVWQGIKPSNNKQTRFVELPAINESTSSEAINLTITFSNGCHLKLGGELTTLCRVVQSLATQAEAGL